MSDDHLTEILNGLVREDKKGQDVIRVFYNDRGEPTDDFLEALRREIGRDRIPYRLYEDGFGSDSQDDEQSFSEKENRYFQSRSNKNNESAKHSYPKWKSTESNNSHYDEVLPRKVRKKQLNANIGKIKKSVKRVGSSSAIGDKVYSISSTDKGLGALTSAASVKADTDLAENGRDERASELEAKLSSMRLRIQGQQNTIRALEARVAEMSNELDSKSNEIAILTKKVRSSTIKEPTKSAAQVKGSDLKKFEDQIKYLKSANESLREKMTDDAAKLKRAEDRSREMREYAEKSKASLIALELKVQDQTSLVEQLQTRLQHYRKEGREYNSKIGVATVAAEERLAEVRNLQAKLEIVEEKLKMCTLERDKFKMSNQKLRSELVAAIDKLNHSQLELGVMKERERSRKSTEKIKVREVDVATSKLDDEVESHVKSISSPRQGYDWAKSNNSIESGKLARKEAKKLRKSLDSPVHITDKSKKKRQSRDDSFIRPKRPPISIWDSDFPVSDSDAKNRTLSELIEDDVSAVMGSLHNGKSARQLSAERGDATSKHVPSTNKENNIHKSRAAEARQRFDKLNEMYKRVAGKNCNSIGSRSLSGDQGHSDDESSSN